MGSKTQTRADLIYEIIFYRVGINRSFTIKYLATFLEDSHVKSTNLYGVLSQLIAEGIIVCNQSATPQEYTLVKERLSEKERDEQRLNFHSEIRRILNSLLGSSCTVAQLRKKLKYRIGVIVIANYLRQLAIQGDLRREKKLNGRCIYYIDSIIKSDRNLGLADVVWKAVCDRKHESWSQADIFHDVRTVPGVEQKSCLYNSVCVVIRRWRNNGYVKKMNRGAYRLVEGVNEQPPTVDRVVNVA